MDFGKIDLRRDSEAGAWMTVKHPVSGADTEARIFLLGRDSAAYRAVEDRQMRAKMERALAERLGQETTDEWQSTMEEAVERAVAVTKDWQEIGWNGEPLPCTPDNVRMLYQKHQDWLVPQIIAFVEKRANFFKG